jgi:hypothetical protein
VVQADSPERRRICQWRPRIRSSLTRRARFSRCAAEQRGNSDLKGEKCILTHICLSTRWRLTRDFKFTAEQLQAIAFRIRASTNTLNNMFRDGE